MGKKVHAAKAEAERAAQAANKAGQTTTQAANGVIDEAVVKHPPKDRFHRPVPERRFQTTSPR